MIMIHTVREFLRKRGYPTELHNMLDSAGVCDDHGVEVWSGLGSVDRAVAEYVLQKDIWTGKLRVVL